MALCNMQIKAALIDLANHGIIALNTKDDAIQIKECARNIGVLVTVTKSGRYFMVEEVGILPCERSEHRHL